MLHPLRWRRPVRREFSAAAAALTLAAALSGCQAPPPEQNAAALSALSPAHGCTASLPTFGRFPGGPDATFDTYLPPDGRIAMANDGGWCTIAFTHNWRGGTLELVSPLSVRVPPAHGEAMVGSVGTTMRIAYRPAPGYVGPDRFSVHMAGPDPWNIPVRVVVTR